VGKGTSESVGKQVSTREKEVVDWRESRADAKKKRARGSIKEKKNWGPTGSEDIQGGTKEKWGMQPMPKGEY